MKFFIFIYIFTDRLKYIQKSLLFAFMFATDKPYAINEYPSSIYKTSENKKELK